MTWVVVLKSGKNLNASLSSIEYDCYGQRTKQPVIICNDWLQGFQQAKDQKYQQALFVDSGTVFSDWHHWQTLVDSYPHQGLIAHLIWHPGQTLMLDQQCWFMDLPLFEAEDFVIKRVAHPSPMASDQHIHSDYTPLWVRPTAQATEYDVTGFGQGLIARHLSRGRGIVNWNKSARDIKWYLYPDQPELLDNLAHKMHDYVKLAENQLWVLNNEPTRLSTGTGLVTPGAGMLWMLNIVQPNIQNLQVVDISRRQIDFCQALWENWNGNDYGTFAWEFIKQNALKHFEIDQADLGALERLKLHSRSTFVSHVNNKFNDTLAAHNITDFESLWHQAQKNKNPSFVVGNLVDWILQNGLCNYDSVWCSNILTYKWTLINNTLDEFEQFENIVKKVTCI